MANGDYEDRNPKRNSRRRKILINFFHYSILCERLTLTVKCYWAQTNLFDRTGPYHGGSILLHIILHNERTDPRRKDLLGILNVILHRLPEPNETQASYWRQGQFELAIGDNSAFVFKIPDGSYGCPTKLPDMRKYRGTQNSDKGCEKVRVQSAKFCIDVTTLFSGHQRILQSFLNFLCLTHTGLNSFTQAFSIQS